MEESGAKSLAFLAQKACIKYLKRINDIGDCPYDLIRPVLLKLENPEQLHQLEINSPQIIGLDSEIWLHFIKRDIPDWENKPHQPKNPRKWWEVYKKLREQTRKDRELGAQRLKAVLDSNKEEKEQNLAKVISRKDLPKEPANSRARTLWNSNSGKTGSKSKLSLLEKIRKEARDARLARVNVPTSQLLKKPTQVPKAPAGLVEDLKREAQQKSPIAATPAKPSPAPRAPRPPLAVRRLEVADSDDAFQEREERLRSLTGGQPPKPTPASDPAKKIQTSLEQPSNPPTTTSPELQPRSRWQNNQQTDGADEDDEDIEPPSTTPTRPPKSNTADALTPTASTGTIDRRPAFNSSQGANTPPPPRSRFASPTPQPKPKQKRKLEEPSLFMKARKPRI